MNRTQLRSAFRNALAGHADELSDAEVDEYLNSIWQYEIPSRVGHGFREGSGTFTLNPGQEIYDLQRVEDVGSLAGTVRSLTSDIWIEPRSVPLRYFTETEDFYRWHNPFNDQALGRPQSVLYYADALRFRNVPDQAYVVTLHGTFFRPALTSSGVANKNQAKAVWGGAVRDYALEEGLVDIYQQFELFSEKWIGLEVGNFAVRPQTQVSRADY